ncbi:MULTISPECIES: type ISP restriction/modification enzyme [Streptomyces]|uniref:type ISP restriction/modification enzyme n=1 Tax=Streptomyces TaxID=1883 RepID=UPI001E6411DA|nr:MULTISPECIES: type ISP restriction/modification enzyme [Streptomyces]UFQ14746.1 DNA methyltransferase [Streptomyces huasconensis]WCL84349.1 DNA methyltransferase [Streptomyces sp. JCM 35825]
MPGVTHDEAPLLADLMPWSVAPLRPGRGWPMGPDAASLKARWAALVRARGADREALFRPTRSRTLHTAVAQLPGHQGGTVRLAREGGPCPEPVRVLHGPFDEQWLIPDHRLIDVARPELWRVAGAGQLFVVEQGYVAGAAGPAVLASAVLPDGHSPAGRPGRIRPLFRRPGGLEPNVAPGLLPYLSRALDQEVTARALLAWVLATASGSAAGCRVPLTADAGVWARGVELGERLLWLQVRGDGERPKLPGGRRPYVRAPLPARPGSLAYDAEERVLRVGEVGVISPVPREAWAFEVGGVRVIERWFGARAAGGDAGPGTLEAIRPATWPQAWTSELLELITVLALMAEVAPRQRELATGADRRITVDELGGAGVLPVPDGARRPASVLDHREEGPDGQFALI